MNQSPTLPQPPAELPKPKSKLWLWIILIIVVLTAAGYFGWTWYSGKSTISTITTPTTSTTTPTASVFTADWKTYKNEKNKYSFRYPIDWWILEDSIVADTEANSQSDYIILKAQNDDSGYYMTITRFINSEKSLDELLTATMTGEDPATYTASDIILAGIPAKKIDITQRSGMKYLDVGGQILENNENIYIVKNENKVTQIIISGQIWKQYKTIFEQVLSTFQFTQ